MTTRFASLLLLSGCSLFGKESLPIEVFHVPLEKVEWGQRETDSTDGRFYPFDVWTNDNYPLGYACASPEEDITELYFESDAYFALNKAGAVGTIVGRPDEDGTVDSDQRLHLAPEYATLELKHRACAAGGGTVQQHSISTVRGINQYDANAEGVYPSNWTVDFGRAANPYSDTDKFTSSMINMFGRPTVKLWTSYPNPAKTQHLSEVSAATAEAAATDACVLYQRGVGDGDIWKITGISFEVKTDKTGSIGFSTEVQTERVDMEGQTKIVLDWGNRNEEYDPCNIVGLEDDEEEEYDTGMYAPTPTAQMCGYQLETLPRYPGDAQCVPGRAILRPVLFSSPGAPPDGKALLVEQVLSGSVGPEASVVSITGDTSSLVMKGYANASDVLPALWGWDNDYKPRVWPLGLLHSYGSLDQTFEVEFDCEAKVHEVDLFPGAPMWEVTDLFGQRVRVAGTTLPGEGNQLARTFSLAGRREQVTVPLVNGMAQLRIRRDDNMVEGTWNEETMEFCFGSFCAVGRRLQ